MPDDVQATDAALIHAAELGVDISQVQGSGTGGKITKADVAAHVDAQAETEPEPSGGWWYCLDAKHPGSAELLDDSRFFQSDEEGAPTCPVCGHQVSAVPTSGKGTYPSSILAVAERLV